MAKNLRIALVLLAIGSSPTAAQDLNGIFGVIGGAMAAQQRQIAAGAWSRQPELRRYCFQRLLAQRGVRLDQVIDAGIEPGDRRLNDVSVQCARLDPSNLRSNYRCSVPNEEGAQVPSLCNQSFARAILEEVEEDGAAGYSDGQPVDARTAIDLATRGERVVLIDIESALGKQERYERVRSQQRLTQLVEIKSAIEPFQTSVSPVVQAQARALIGRAAVATRSGAASADLVDGLRRENLRLAELQKVEVARMTAVDRLKALKDAVDAKAARAGADLQTEADRLTLEYAAVVAPPVIKAKPTAAASTAPAIRIRPTFDCAEAKAPLEKVVCSNETLSALDVEMFVPFYVLRHLTPDAKTSLREEAIENTRRTLDKCKIPGAGGLPEKAFKAAATCVIRQYRGQRDVWRSRAGDLSSSARDEANRNAGEHLRLEAALQSAGFLPPDAKLDGVYGTNTRAAITAFQGAEGLSIDGLMTAETAARLLQRASSGPAIPETPVADSGLPGRIATLEGKYRTLELRADAAIAKQARLEKLRRQTAEARDFYRSAIAQSLPPAMLELAEARLNAIAADDATASEDDMARAVRDFDEAKPKIDDAGRVVKATTSKNAFIMNGDANDLLLLYNDSGRAPSVIKNIRGDLVFEANRTAACQIAAGGTDVATSRALNARLQRWGQSLKLPLPRCDLGALQRYDLVLLSRGGFLKEKAGDIVAVLSAVDTGVLASMLTVSAEEAKTDSQAEAVRALEIEAAVEKDGKPGYGFVALETGSAIACSVVADNREAHEQVVKPFLSRLAEELKGTPAIVATSVDAAFVAAKRGQCGAIYASGSDLKEIVAALRRDGLPFRYLPTWIEIADVEAAAKALDEMKSRESQQDSDRRKQVDDAKKIQAAKDQEEAVVKARRQAEMRQQYGAMARALELRLTDDFKDFVEGRQTTFGQKYELVADWYRAQLADRWELVSIDTSLLDYGVSEYKSRSLETGLAKSNVKLRNKLLGEYRTECFVTGFIDDQEFQIEREHVDVPCDAGGPAIDEFKRGQRFTSRWIVQ